VNLVQSNRDRPLFTGGRKEALEWAFDHPMIGSGHLWIYDYVKDSFNSWISFFSSAVRYY
jgi:hypothetical protein